MSFDKELLDQISKEDRVLLRIHYFKTLTNMVSSTIYMVDFLIADNNVTPVQKVMLEDTYKRLESFKNRLEQIDPEVCVSDEDHADFYIEALSMITLIPSDAKKLKSPFLYELSKAIKRQFPKEFLKKNKKLINEVIK